VERAVWCSPRLCILEETHNQMSNHQLRTDNGKLVANSEALYNKFQQKAKMCN
jgi:hypothetical protein